MTKEEIQEELDDVVSQIERKESNIKELEMEIEELEGQSGLRYLHG